MLSQVDRAELSLKQRGYRELRVRHFGDLGRVQLGGSLNLDITPVSRAAESPGTPGAPGVPDGAVGMPDGAPMMPNGRPPTVPPGTEAAAAGVPLGEFAVLDVDRRRRTGVPSTPITWPERSPSARCRPRGNVLVVTAGTTDLKVARECAVTLAVLGIRADVLADVGMAGFGRLLSRLEDLRAAECVVVVAGMDGALPSVVPPPPHNTFRAVRPDRDRGNLGTAGARPAWRWRFRWPGRRPGRSRPGPR